MILDVQPKLRFLLNRNNNLKTIVLNKEAIASRGVMQDKSKATT